MGSMPLDRVPGSCPPGVTPPLKTWKTNRKEKEKEVCMEPVMLYGSSQLLPPGWGVSHLCIELVRSPLGSAGAEAGRKGAGAMP